MSEKRVVHRAVRGQWILLKRIKLGGVFEYPRDRSGDRFQLVRVSGTSRDGYVTSVVAEPKGASQKVYGERRVISRDAVLPTVARLHGKMWTSYEEARTAIMQHLVEGVTPKPGTEFPYESQRERVVPPPPRHEEGG